MRRGARRRRASPTAACALLSAAIVVSAAVRAPPVMLEAISVDLVAARLTLRLISLVVAVFPSIALAVVDRVSLICSMIPEIWSIAATAAPESERIASIRPPMSSVTLDVSRARSLTSLATTARPVPASPVRAATPAALALVLGDLPDRGRHLPRPSR